MIKTLLLVLILTITFNAQIITNQKVKATAYCLKGSRTASGKFPIEGMVAADTKYYTLGQYITLDGRKYIVADTGGKIKGPARFDIYLYSCSQAIKFGVKYMSLLI